MLPTLARLAHEARVPLLRFPTKAARASRSSPPSSLRALQLTRFPHAAPHHAPAPHPCAPQSAIDSFPAFLARLQGSSSGGAGKKAAASSGSKVPEAQYEGEWEMPARFQRGIYSPSEAEIEAVEVRSRSSEERGGAELMRFVRWQSGGATAAPVVSKAYREKWYTAQV